jgi:hypothetical protein
MLALNYVAKSAEDYTHKTGDKKGMSGSAKTIVLTPVGCEMGGLWVGFNPIRA